MQVLRFSAIWCPACLVMPKRWNEVFSKYSNIKIADYDYDMNRDVVTNYNIGKIIPVLIFIDDNNIEKGRIIGEKSVKELELLVKKLMEEQWKK